MAEEFPDRKIHRSNSEERRCTTCRKILPRFAFYKNKSTPSGLDNNCKNCRKANEKKRYAEGKKPDIYGYKDEAKRIVGNGNLSCVCCGNKNFEWLQIDHIEPIRRGINRKISFAQLTKKIALGEIPSNKFQLLCGSCNFAKGANEKCPIDHSLD